jgi:hypothetical protein
MQKKYRRYRNTLFYSYGLCTNFISILALILGIGLTNYLLLDFSKRRMNSFAVGATSQHKIFQTTYYTNILKFQIETYITDYANYSIPLVTANTPASFITTVKSSVARRNNVTFPVLDYIYSINANSTETFGMNLFHKPFCEEFSKININLPPMEEKRIPKKFCESISDGLPRISLLKSILWVSEKEGTIIELTAGSSKETIFGLYRTFDFIAIELQINIILEH